MNPQLLEFVSLRDNCAWVHGTIRPARPARPKRRCASVSPASRHFEPYDKESRTPQSLGPGHRRRAGRHDLRPVHRRRGLRRLPGGKDGHAGRQPAPPVPDRRGTKSRSGCSTHWSSGCTATSASRSTTTPRSSALTATWATFRTRLSYAGDGEPARCWEIEHGVAVVATGGYEYKGNVFLYGEDPRVVTQLELEKRLAEDVDAAPRTAPGGHDPVRQSTRADRSPTAAGPAAPTR